jgi:hypothetical protein
MPRVRTLYVRDEDASTWEEAAEAAKREGVSLSEYVTTVVRGSLERRQAARDFELLAVDSLEPFGRGMAVRRTMQFEGRWILREARSTAPGAIPGDLWNLAVTKGGVFVAHVLRSGRDPLVGTDPDLIELQRKFLVPDDIIESAVQVLGEQGWVVLRDL